MRVKVCLFFAVAALCSLSAYGQERANLGIGYDEGLAAKYYFSDRLGAEVSLGFEYLGGYDATANNNNTGQDPEADGSIGAAFLISVFKSQHAYLDVMAQMAYSHNDTPDPNDVGDRDWGFLRVAIAPEIMPTDFLGLGFRFGLEVASMSSSRQYVAGGGTVDTDDARTNVRFFGPRNPFYGAGLGIALFVYPGGL